ncbi:hypothetical protein C8J56DRAFT_1139390 [Mycena floridula]|nr:hypothetical protein C8J56DRAFT_1139390 [Mycena floridula]
MSVLFPFTATNGLTTRQAKPLTRPWFACFCKFQQTPASFCPHEFRDWVFLMASRLNDGLWWIQNIAVPSRLSEQKAFLLFLPRKFGGPMEHMALPTLVCTKMFQALFVVNYGQRKDKSSSSLLAFQRPLARPGQESLRDSAIPHDHQVLCTADPQPPPKVSRGSWLDDSLQPSKAQQLRPASWKKSSYQARFRFTAFALVKMISPARQYKDGFTYRRRRPQDQAVV